MAAAKASAAKPGTGIANELRPLEEAPAYLAERQGQPARGSENVTAKDILIPRIEVAQALSKCLKRSETALYIEGAVAGSLYNSVTRQLYGSQVIICPIFFKVEYLIWKDRKAGGGFRGAFETEEAALRAKRELEDANQCEVQETHQHFCVALSHGKMEDAVISMSRTKLKVSRNFNSLVRMGGGDRFSRLYKVGTSEEKNDKGDFYNFTIGSFGFAPEEAFRRAERMYALVEAGRAQADRTYDEEGEPVGDRSSEM